MTQKLNQQFIGKGEVKGFSFSKVDEGENWYIYKVKTQNSENFEAFLKKEVLVCVDFEKRIYSETEKKEVYPKSKDFGVWAWAVSSIEEGKKLLEIAISKKKTEVLND